MFASLKNKIREETGSDISKITSSWRSGAFLGRPPPKEETATSPTSSVSYGDANSEWISPKLESYLEERLSEAQLQERLTEAQLPERLTEAQLQERLRERDAAWEQRLQELTTSHTSTQGEEAAAAQAVARAAAAEAAAAAGERDAALRQLQELREAAGAARLAQDRLDALTEELELARREWGRERAEYKVQQGEAEARTRSLVDELALLKASLPPGHPHHLFEDEEGVASGGAGGACGGGEGGAEEAGARCRRERAVLRRQLQEARLALADVKTSWSSQIASLETQVARVSRQAGEEGAERRRALADNLQLREELAGAHQHLAKLKQNLANSEAKVARLSAEVRSVSGELRGVRAAAAASAKKISELESRMEEVIEENEELRRAVEGERADARAARDAESRARAEARGLGALAADLQHDCIAIEKKYEKEKREKDDALLRNAQMSQSMELKKCDMREQESEIVEFRAKVAELEAIIADHRENEAACMLIQEKETSREQQIEQLESRVQELTATESKLSSTVEDLEAQLADKNKKMKCLDKRIADMKKTLERELASGKAEPTSAEEAEISRRYLKHVVLRFVTAREEARQLTRALSALLRLSAHEEAALQAALPPPPRTALARWLPALSPT